MILATRYRIFFVFGVVGLTACYQLRPPQVGVNAIENAIDLVIESDGKPALLGHLGWSLPSAIGNSSETCDPGEADECYEFGDYARVYLTRPSSTNDNCARIDWHSTFARRLEDCYNLQDGVHWYGGMGQKFLEAWPIESLKWAESAVVAGGFWNGMESGGLSENYWITSSGTAFHVDETVPFFWSLNSDDRPGQVCFVARNDHPYRSRNELRLGYHICTGGAGENFRDVHKRAIKKFYDLPVDIPDVGMLLKPFWSTWAEYKEEVNQTVVIGLAETLIEKGFQNSSHVEIDDNWETCYGELAFDRKKFPDPAAMTADLRAMGLKTTLWIHPFINYECPLYMEAFTNGYLIVDEAGNMGMTRWWQSKHAAGSGLIDFTNPEAAAWFIERLEKLRTDFGIDSFKFDAGEVKEMPYSNKLTGDSDNFPNLFTTKFVETYATLGNMIEVRVGRRNQREPIFMRMVDKNSNWGYNLGLKALIPALLDFGIKGYIFVMPDMIGGNAYGNLPSKELFIRWMQANTFMPSVQFSIMPWNYDEETVDVVRKMVRLREEFSDRILDAARQALVDFSPINRPMWWVDPLDANSLTIDDQFMVGDDLLVAPVLEEGATARNVYLPRGHWTTHLPDGSTGIYEGPMLLVNHDAPLSYLPFFIREPTH